VHDGVVVSYRNTISFITMDGVKAWTRSFASNRSYSGIDLKACSSTGEVYVAAGNVLIALTSDGKTKWSFTTKCLDNSKCFGSMHVTKNGAVFVSLFSNGFISGPGALLAFSASGKQLWSTPWKQHEGSPMWPGKGESKHLVFIAAWDSILAVAWSDGSTKWSIPASMGDGVAVGVDGALLLASRTKSLPSPDGVALSAYSAAGHLIWKRTLISRPWAPVFSYVPVITVGDDGVVLVSVAEQNSSSRSPWPPVHSKLIAFNSAGEAQWNMTSECDMSLPSKTESKENKIFITRSCSSANISIVAIAKDTGVQSVFSQIDTSLMSHGSRTWQPVVAPGGSIYLPDARDDTASQLYILKPNGQFSRRVQSEDVPVFAEDGMAYALVWDESYDPAIHGFHTKHSLLALNADTGATKWEYIFEKSFEEKPSETKVLIVV